MESYYHCSLCQEAQLSLKDGETEKKKHRDEMRRDYMQQKDTELLRSGIVCAGIFIKLMHWSKVILEKISLANVFGGNGVSRKEISLRDSLD